MTWTTRPRCDALGALARVRIGRVALDDLPDSAPIVLLHGVGLRAEAWGAQVDALAAMGDVHALDLPGHGDSAGLVGAPTLADFTDCVATAVAMLDAPALLVGHSMGAMIALDLAIRYPQLCRGVAALNAIYRRAPEAAAAVRVRAASMSLDAPADAAPTLRRWFGDAQQSDAALACREWLLGADLRGYQMAYSAFAHADGPDDAGLARLACPALFATGADEPNSTPAMSRAMAALVSDGEAVIVDGAAHMMPMTHAAQLNALLRTFFDRCWARAS